MANTPKVELEEVRAAVVGASNKMSEATTAAASKLSKLIENATEHNKKLAIRLAELQTVCSNLNTPLSKKMADSLQEQLREAYKLNDDQKKLLNDTKNVLSEVRTDKPRLGK